MPDPSTNTAPETTTAPDAPPVGATPPTTSLVSPSTPEPPRRRGLWGAWITQFVAPIAPRSALARAEGISLPIAFLSHLTIAPLVAFGCFIVMTAAFYFPEQFVSWMVQVMPNSVANMGMTSDHVSQGYVAFIAGPLRQFVDELDELNFWIPFIIVLLIFEGILFLVACCILPFGARRERRRDSLRHALRCTWLQTGTIFWFFTILAFHVAIVNALEESARETPYDARPVFMRHVELIVLLGVTLGAGFVLWKVLAGVASRTALPVIRTTLCEHCGYDISHTPRESLCPECGVPASQSLAGRRAAPAFEARRGFVAFCATWLAVVCSPSGFFGRLPVRGNDGRARRFAAINLVLTATLFQLCMSLALYVTDRRWIGDDAEFWFGFFLLSLFAAAALTGLCAVVSGLFYSRDGRNLFPAAGRVACYSTAFYPITILAYFAIICGSAEALGLSVRWYRGGPKGWMYFEILCWLLAINAICFWGWRVWSAMPLIRYANEQHGSPVETEFATSAPPTVPVVPLHAITSAPLAVYRPRDGRAVTARLQFVSSCLT